MSWPLEVGRRGCLGATHIFVKFCELPCFGHSFDIFRAAQVFGVEKYLVIGALELLIGIYVTQ